MSGSGWALWCSCYGISTHNIVPSRAPATPYPVSPVLYSRFQHVRGHCCVASRHARRASTGLAPTHANGCVALTPFQPTACICIPLCINSVVLQALRERYNAYLCPLAALVFTMYLYICMLIFEVVNYI